MSLFDQWVAAAGRIGVDSFCIDGGWGGKYCGLFLLNLGSPKSVTLRTSNGAAALFSTRGYCRREDSGFDSITRESRCINNHHSFKYSYENNITKPSNSNQSCLFLAIGQGIAGGV